MSITAQLSAFSCGHNMTHGQPHPHGVPLSVVFDLDGVLIDSTENMRVAFAAAWREAGVTHEPPFDTFLTHMGAPLPVILRTMGLPESAAKVYTRESASQLSLVRAHPGILELLHELRDAGVPTAVATGKSLARAMQALEATALAPYLDIVVGSDLVANPKPAPDILLLALQQLSARHIRPLHRRAPVFVGDSVLDIRCGRAAGIAVVAAGWGQCPPNVLMAEHPDAFAGTPADLYGPLGLDMPRPVSPRSPGCAQ